MEKKVRIVLLPADGLRNFESRTGTRSYRRRAGGAPLSRCSVEAAEESCIPIKVTRTAERAFEYVVESAGLPQRKFSRVEMLLARRPRAAGPVLYRKLSDPAVIVSAKPLFFGHATLIPTGSTTALSCLSMSTISGLSCDGYLRMVHTVWECDAQVHKAPPSGAERRQRGRVPACICGHFHVGRLGVGRPHHADRHCVAG